MTRPIGPEGAGDAGEAGARPCQGTGRADERDPDNVDGGARRGSRRVEHWDAAYTRLGPEGVSWYQSNPAFSLELVARLGIPPDAAVIDVGGGASLFADRLLEGGYSDVTVLDVSAAALEVARRRLEGNPAVTWEQADVLEWRPGRRYLLWHDRAVFHFLVDPMEREGYLRALHRALAPGGHVVLATFAPDGPQHCSGLPVARYSPEDLLTALGSGFAEVASTREAHRTPAGELQPFTWVVARALPPVE